jgi:hypothetical protein
MEGVSKNSRCLLFPVFLCGAFAVLRVPPDRSIFPGFIPGLRRNDMNVFWAGEMRFSCFYTRQKKYTNLWQ